MSLATSAANNAHKMLVKYGADAALKVVSTGAYNPATSSTSNTETSFPIRIYEEDVSAKDLKDSAVKSSSKKIIMSVLTGAPKPQTNDKITYQGNEYTVDECIRVNASGVAVIYTGFMSR